VVARPQAQRRAGAGTARHAVMDYEQIAQEIIEEAKQIDAADDGL
jgi:hypothetical protein